MTPPANYVILIIRLNNPLDELEIEMNIEQLLLDALTTIKLDGPFWNAHGICDNLKESDQYIPVSIDDDLIELWEGTLTKLMITWPKFSGNECYPVPSPDLEEGSQQVYMRTHDEWSGEYGALRYELLDFLIDELTKVVEKCDE